MKTYLQDLINRLSKFSNKIDSTTLITDKPWVLIDNELNYHKYIFKKNNELIMSLNGQVQVGKWEYYVEAKSLLIDRIGDKVLLNQSFVDNGIMILKVDGTSNDFLIFANERIIPDLNIEKYLQSVIYKKLNIITGRLENGKTIEAHAGTNKSFVQIGMIVTIDGEKPEDGKYKSKNTGHTYELKNGRIFNIRYPIKYKCVDGTNIVIEQLFKGRIIKGDLVYINNQLAVTEKYKLGTFKNLIVVNGVITKLTLF